MPASSVRTVPFRCTVSGMTLCALDPVSKLVTDTTTCFTGSALRLAMVCSASTMCEAMTVVSIVSCGLAACPPLPVT